MPPRHSTGNSQTVIALPSLISLSPDHAYLLGGVVVFYLSNLFLGASVGAARKQYGIQYPHLYATRGMFLGKDGQVDEARWEADGVKFNLVQRGHQHLTETEPTALALMLSCGVFYPAYAATWGLVWVAGSLAYAFGYATKPENRFFGEALFIPASLAWIYGLYCAGTALLDGRPVVVD